MDISHWDAAIHYGITACPILWSNPILDYAISRRSSPLYSLALRLRNTNSTCVDSWVHRVPENGHQPLGRGNSLWRSACPILWSNPFLLRYFTEIAASQWLCSLAPRTQEHQSTCVDSWVHREYPKMDISHWDAAIHYGVQLAQYCDQTRSFNAISRRSPPVYSLATQTQEHQSTCVDSWVHRVPENGHQPLGRGNSLWRAACPILWSKRVWSLSCYAISRRLPLLCSLALRLRNTKVPVWTHESIGYPKVDISHWDAAMPLWRSLPNIVIKPFLVMLFHGDCPLCVLPCPETQEHQSTCVDSWVHRVPENGHQPLGRGNSLWHSACPILWSNPIFYAISRRSPPSVLPCPKTQEHQSTCVDSWVHRVPENGYQPLGRGNSLWRAACPILWFSGTLSWVHYFTEIGVLCAPLP